MRLTLTLVTILIASNIISQDNKNELEKVGIEIFLMLKNNDFSKIDAYLVNEQNFEQLLPLYQLSKEEEKKWRENKEEMVENTRNGIINELKKNRKYCSENKLDWSKAKNYMDVNVEANQIMYSLGEGYDGCEIYVYLVQVNKSWIILEIET